MTDVQPTQGCENTTQLKLDSVHEGPQLCHRRLSTALQMWIRNRGQSADDTKDALTDLLAG